MPDDLDRLERLRQGQRSDISVAHRMQRFVEALQIRICHALECVDGEAHFRSDAWQRPGGGGGLSRILESGNVFEKAGVNTSAVYGELPDRMAEALGARCKQFFATGISIVVHPQSPYVPAVHANFRYFALGADLYQPEDQWFGGGADLTPYYPFLSDVQHFHRVWKEVCDRHEEADYSRFKEQCDAYFYLPHRGETRGAGGIFFDYLRGDIERGFFFSRDAGRSFLNSYVPIVQRRKDMPYGETECLYQEIRRGRYAEFNLLYDKGTRFGVETNGRTESILMSLPPRAQWRYDWQPEPGSPESQALWYFAPHDWLELSEAQIPSLKA